ncbi:nucleoside monophosphate kinase [Candidatus Uhrbacteria bacterium]|nr:nucleoside monophosphate kinase [Candidatus Uhrbacteria bacterium]
MPRKRLQALIFGPQGSGKSTQGHLLSDWFGVPLTSSGDMIREEIEKGSTLGHMVEEYVASGVLAPDEVVNAIILKRLKEVSAERGFVLDGYPRNVEQAESLDRIMKIHLAIQLKMRDGEAVRRLQGRRQCSKCRSIFHVDELSPAQQKRCSLCGCRLIKREDDEEETIRRRLASYHFMTEPMSAYYRERGVLLMVNAEQSIKQLFEEIVRKIRKLGFVV